ncbi:hypothetical protein V5799_006683 [Amblyomma americanum]|uniref:Uncharacterized protein n=1 Tax=Amblyomma americanum TaxID=6943 RepID=A0AAQ4DVQ1_AMBAM
MENTVVHFSRYNVPVLDEALLASRYKLKPEDIACFYAEMLRNESASMPDNTSILGPQHRVEFGRPLTEAEYISLWCNETSSGGRTFFLHYFLIPRRKKKSTGSRTVYDRRLNVLIVGLDGTSRLNTIRQLPRTRRFLTRTLNAFEFRGYTKVGINSFPNLMPFMTGKSGEAVRESVGNRDQRIFAYLWFTWLTHDHLNTVGYLDQPLEAMLKSLYACGTFNDTALLVFADHGLRYGLSRMTEVGRQEDAMPACLLALPPHFLRRYPEAVVNLEVNQRRLVTAYDLHATLLTLAELPRFKPAVTARGLSLFGRIPPERTCSDAYVPDEFCPCADEYVVSRQQPAAVSQLSLAVVAYINKIATATFPGKCNWWELMRVENAAFSKPLNGTSGDDKQLLFRLTLVTAPEAFFEVSGFATPGRAANSWREMRVTAIERLDAFKNQTMCLPLHDYQKLCRCRLMWW